MTQDYSNTTPRPAAVQFTDGSLPLPAHHEEESETITNLKDIPLTLSRTKTGDSTSSRRSSFGALVERLRSRPGSRSRSQSRSRSNGGDHANDQEGNNGGPGGSPNSGRNSLEDDYQFKYSGRRSSDFTGAYADVARAQAMFMEKLRDDQEMKNIKRNADGLPIPPPLERRRSSVVEILGMGKPLLSR
ncbi:hypothetical protein BG011_008972 [Mortierella polycephala]|uniref:Uncharacterized protein n=1 Tax=Mortierella polycephala TaxID=41804 RepID=A0A9P6PM24_9FUNG|nr:hypothetical protein BG011_008972 [Mortierella polycephala]